MPRTALVYFVDRNGKRSALRLIQASQRIEADGRLWRFEKIEFDGALLYVEDATAQERAVVERLTKIALEGYE